MHHRRSVRLKGYDYPSEGLYFITICTQNKQCVFGHISNDEMYLNELGQMVQEEWQNTMSVRKDEVELHDFIVMPNHIHAIIEICPQSSHSSQSADSGVCDTPLRSPSKTVGAVVRGFKGATTKRAGVSIWQRNYYEHIIRGPESYGMIANYIQTNPMRWDIDQFYNI